MLWRGKKIARLRLVRRSESQKRNQFWWRDPAVTLTAIATLILAVLAVVQACIVYEQLQAARLDQRPWLTVGLAKSEPGAPSLTLGLDSNGLRVTVRLSIRNSGRLPAEVVTVNSLVFPSSPHIPAESAKMQEMTCRNPNIFGATLYADQTIGDNINRSFYLGWEQINNYWKAKPYLKQFSEVAPFVVICVGYTDPDGSIHHSPLRFPVDAYDSDALPSVYKRAPIKVDAAVLAKETFFPGVSSDYAMNPD